MPRSVASSVFKRDVLPAHFLRSFHKAGVLSGLSDTQRFYGAWNRLLAAIFPPESVFEVVPYCYPGEASDPDTDPTVTLYVYADATLALILDCRPPDHYEEVDKRALADSKLRARFAEVAKTKTPRLPVLYGISALGTKLSFYSSRDNVIEPAAPAPKQRWAHSVQSPEGFARFCQVVKHVRTMTTNNMPEINDAMEKLEEKWTKKREEYSEIKHVSDILHRYRSQAPYVFPPL